MKNIHSYLSRIASRMFPGSVVSFVDEGRESETWTLDRPGLEPVVLGRTFVDARGSVIALSQSERVRIAKG